MKKIIKLICAAWLITQLAACVTTTTKYRSINAVDPAWYYDDDDGLYYRNRSILIIENNRNRYHGGHYRHYDHGFRGKRGGGRHRR